MKVYELLSFNKELLKKLQSIGVKVEDCNVIDMFNEYAELKKDGNKITYIVYRLSSKYKISERKIYSIVKRMQQDVDTAFDVH